MVFVIGGILAIMYFTSCSSIVHYFKASKNSKRTELDNLKETEFAHSTQAIVLKHVTHRQLHLRKHCHALFDCLCPDKFDADEEEDVRGIPWHREVEIILRTEWSAKPPTRPFLGELHHA